jgi:putative lipoprotein
MSKAPTWKALVFAGVVLLLMASEARAQQQDADPWFGHDKALHFAASASIAVVSYAGVSLATEERPTRIVAAFTIALGAGVLKEAWDLTGHGDASWRDLTWDVVGTTTGVLLAYAVDWAIGRLRGPAAVTMTGR